MKKTKLTKVLCLVLSLMMILCAAPLTVFAADSVTYVDRAWDAAAKKVTEEPKTASATPITGDETTLDGGWYVVNGTLEASNRITVNGDNDNPTCIILADGCKFTAAGGIDVTSGKTLNIYSQANGTGELTATGGNYVAAIGGNDCSSGTVSMSSGTCGTVTIHGGTVIATGGSNGAGIGGGCCGIGGNVTIYSGTVIATGGSDGAGIGGGYGAKFSGGGGGTLTVCGGTVEAFGGNYAAGIGGGYFGRGGTFTMNGGTVTATGGISGAGIGPGEKSHSNGTIILGTVVEGYATDTLGEKYNITTAENEKPVAYFDGADREINDSSFKKIELHAVAHTHSFLTGWTHNAIGHWHGCAAMFCNIASISTCGLDSVAYAEHTYSEGICSVCGYVEGSGDGTAEYPYRIATKAELEKVAADVNGGNSYTGNYFVLAEDIGTKADPFSTPIGNGSNPFNGNFEGNDHTVVVDMKGDYSGLFGNVGSSAVIKNVTVSGTVTGEYGNYYFGGVCGNSKGSIINCTNTCTVICDSGCGYCGGVCGYNYGSIINCTNSGTVSSKNGECDIYMVGGVCGCSDDSLIINCTNSGAISSGYYSMDLGGICGLNYQTSIINCTNSGAISSGYGSVDLGGICGNNDYKGFIINCVSSGAIVPGEETTPFGGVCGTNTYDVSVIANCYYDSTVNNTIEGVGIDTGAADVTGLSTEQMTAVNGTENALVDLLNNYIDTENLEDCYHWAKTTDGYPYIAETTYKVTVNASENGKMFVPSGYMDPGATVAVTVVPDVDNVLKNLKYNGGTDKDITETKSFIMPEANVTVSAEFGELVIHIHSFATEWSSDANAHWHACTAEDCDIEDYATCGITGAAYGAHADADGDFYCDTCNYYDEAAAAFAAAKTNAKATLNALIGEDASDALKTIVANAVAAIDTAANQAEITSIVNVAKGNVNTQKYFESSLATEKAKLITALDNSVCDEARAILEKALADLETVTDLNGIYSISGPAVGQANGKNGEFTSKLASYKNPFTINLTENKLANDEKYLEYIIPALENCTSIADLDTLFNAEIGKVQFYTVKNGAATLYDNFYKNSACSDETKALIEEAREKIAAVTYDDFKEVYGEYEEKVTLSRTKDVRIAFVADLCEEDDSSAVKALVEKAIADIANATTTAEVENILGAVISDVETQKEKDAEAAELEKPAALDEVAALATDDDSEAVTAIIEKALADIGNATNVEAIEKIIAAAEAAVSAQKAAEAAAAELAQAKEDAIAEVKAAAEAYGEDADEIVNAAIEAINAAEDLADVDTAKTAALTDIDTLADAGDETDIKGIFSWLVSLIARLIKMFSIIKSIFD